MEKIFCVHVPMICSRLMALECNEVNGEFIPEAASAKEAANQIVADVIQAWREYRSDESGNDMWQNFAEPLGVSHALGSPDAKDFNDLDDCDGIEYEFYGT